MFRLIAINFSQKSPHFSLLSPTSPCELSEREVTSPSNLKVVGALQLKSEQKEIIQNVLERKDSMAVLLMFLLPIIGAC
jgi:hypothetical protein